MPEERLEVQSDEVGNVVRVAVPDDPAELTPQQAKARARELQEAADQVLAYRAAEQTENDERQQSLHDIDADENRESLAEMRDRLTTDDRDRPELGEVRNQTAAGKW